MKKLFALMLMLLVAGMVQVMAQEDDEEDVDPPHYGYIQKYEGTKTCLKCHMKEAKDIFHSVHYQWKGETPNTIGLDGKLHGKINDINDFCTNPGTSRLDLVVNSKGKVIADGCGKCHIGFGMKPSEKMSEAQLENIDCLMCHAPGYSRKLVRQENGKLKWVPKDDPELVTIRAKNVRKASAQMCLRCHAGAGGDTNYKRGDMESAHFEADDTIDVHFAADMACTECHTTRNHRIAGRGVDMPDTDLVGVKVACENCHENDPHDSAILNKHAKTVYCTVCHIPDFARVDATDMARDWRKLEQNPKNEKYDEHVELKKHVRPVYTWWNGKTIFQDANKPIEAVKGIVHMAYPDGSINDPNARIYAFKRHTSMMPVLKKSNLLLPVAPDVAFKTGDINKSVIAGALSYRNIKITKADYKWVKVDRYMGLFHEVLPADKALKCSACHGKKANRFDWKALGYKGDPRKFGGRFTAKKK